MSREEAIRNITADYLAKISEHADVSLVLLSWSEGDTTGMAVFGHGNQFAQRGMVQDHMDREFNRTLTEGE